MPDTTTSAPRATTDSTASRKRRIEWARPATTTVVAYFVGGKGGRKVTYKDLERAGDAAARAFRDYLESRSPTYDIGDLEVTTQYEYRLDRTTRKG